MDVISNTPHVILPSHKQMVDVAVEGGGISGGTNGGEDRWGEGLGLAQEDGSGVVAVSLSRMFFQLGSHTFNSHQNYLPCSSTEA